MTRRPRILWARLEQVLTAISPPCSSLILGRVKRAMQEANRTTGLGLSGERKTAHIGDWGFDSPKADCRYAAARCAARVTTFSQQIFIAKLSSIESASIRFSLAFLLFQRPQALCLRHVHGAILGFALGEGRRAQP